MYNIIILLLFIYHTYYKMRLLCTYIVLIKKCNLISEYTINTFVTYPLSFQIILMLHKLIKRLDRVSSSLHSITRKSEICKHTTEYQFFRFKYSVRLFFSFREHSCAKLLYIVDIFKHAAFE